MFYFLAISLHWSYRNVFLKEFGINNFQLGNILVLLSIFVFLSQIFWGTMADNFGRKKILLIQLVLLTIFLFAFGLASNVIFAVISLYLMSLLSGNVVSVMDSITIDYLGNRRDQYGRVRVFGSIGWTVGNGLAALMVLKFGVRGLMISSGFLMLPLLFNCFKLEESKDVFNQRPRKRNTLLPVLRSHGFLFLLTTNIIVFTGFQSIVIFMPVYISEVLNLKWLVGVALFIAGLFEIIGMKNEEKLSKKIGRTKVIGIGFSAMTAKIILVSLSKNAWGILVAQTLEMFVWGMYYPASIITVGNLVNAEVLSTAQSLFASSFTVISVIVGSFLGGLLADSLGIIWMFRVMAIISLVGVVLFFSLKNKYLPEDIPKEIQ